MNRYWRDAVDLLFSVIIPAYNTEAYVGEAIESALMQHDVQKEVILVDDGSTDKTIDIVKGFGDRVRVVNQANQGPAAARNNGARTARGNVLAFLDADDVWFPNKLRSQSKKIQDGFTMVYTNRYNIGGAGKSQEPLSDKLAMNEGDIWIDLLYMNMITTSSVVIMKDTFNQFGGFRDDLPPCEDWNLWLKCAESHKVGYCVEPLLKYRIHPGGISKNYVSMSKKREEVVLIALNSKRGKQVPALTRRKVLANTWSTSAWGAAEGKDLPKSLAYYCKALSYWPFDGAIWYDVARALAGRI